MICKRIPTISYSVAVPFESIMIWLYPRYEGRKKYFLSTESLLVVFHVDYDWGVALGVEFFTLKKLSRNNLFGGTFMMKIFAVSISILFMSLSAIGANLSSSKSAKCSETSGSYFIMSYPNMSVDNSHGPSSMVPGDVYYKYVGANGVQTSKIFPASSVSVVQNGPNQSFTVFDNSGPVAYLAWGYVNGYNSDPIAKGALGKWAPWEIESSKADLDCQLSDAQFDTYP